MICRMPNPIPPSLYRRPLSEQERCLLTPLHHPGEVNVFFVDSAGFNEPSHAIMDATLAPSLPGDERFAGAAILSSEDTGEFTELYSYGVAHEVAHLVTNQGHVNGFAEETSSPTWPIVTTGRSTLANARLLKRAASCSSFVKWRSIFSTF